MPAKEKEKVARPRIPVKLWFRIQAAAATQEERPEKWLTALIERHMPPAFRGGATK